MERTRKGEMNGSPTVEMNAATTFYVGDCTDVMSWGTRARWLRRSDGTSSTLDDGSDGAKITADRWLPQDFLQHSEMILGRGQFGTVVRATAIRNQKEVALKRIGKAFPTEANSPRRGCPLTHLRNEILIHSS
jgi:hypothetical protein